MEQFFEAFLGASLIMLGIVFLIGAYCLWHDWAYPVVGDRNSAAGKALRRRIMTPYKEGKISRRRVRAAVRHVLNQRGKS